MKSSEVDKGCENSSNASFDVIWDQNYYRSLSLTCFDPEGLWWV